MRPKREKHLEAVKFRNAVIGMNKKIQTAKIAAQLGMGGGKDVILEQLRKINELCEKAVGK